MLVGVVQKGEFEIRLGSILVDPASPRAKPEDELYMTLLTLDLYTLCTQYLCTRILLWDILGTEIRKLGCGKFRLF